MMSTAQDARPATMFEKIWRRHVVAEREDGNTLLFVDRQMLHEGSFHAFNRLRERSLRVGRPAQTIAVADHYVPTKDRANLADPEIRRMLEQFDRNMEEFGIRGIGMDDPEHGIVHVIGPELGFTLPGSILVCGDSHTSTHGALGALAFGIGNTEVSHVLATQTLWQARPRTMRIAIEGRLSPGVTAKDLILSIIARIGSAGASGHVIEYAGPAVRVLDIEERLTLCNMSIEAGGRAGMVAPDETTFAYLKDRPYAPQGAEFDRALAEWRDLPSDAGARFDRDVSVEGSTVEPMVSWGTSPQMASPVTGVVPDPDAMDDPDLKSAARDALDYMDLRPGTRITDIAVDQVFIGSCTNSRLADLRAAAAIARRGKAKVPVLVSPGSHAVKVAAEREGLDRIFKEAGFDWREPGCSMCVAINGDRVPSGKRCASTSNRNFRGRQGRGARTHLVSPPMAAAAALAGRFVDLRGIVGED